MNDRTKDRGCPTYQNELEVGKESNKNLSWPANKEWRERKSKGRTFLVMISQRVRPLYPFPPAHKTSTDRFQSFQVPSLREREGDLASGPANEDQSGGSLGISCRISGDQGNRKGTEWFLIQSTRVCESFELAGGGKWSSLGQITYYIWIYVAEYSPGARWYTHVTLKANDW